MVSWEVLPLPWILEQVLLKFNMNLNCQANLVSPRVYFITKRRTEIPSIRFTSLDEGAGTFCS